MDNTGYIWISSINGAFKYDGSSLQKYSSNPNQLGEIIQSNFFEDSQGCIWTTSNIGLSRYDPQVDTFAHYPLYIDGELQSTEMYFLFYLENDSTLWLRARDQIVKYDPYRKTGFNICVTEGVRFTVDTFPGGEIKRIISCPWLNKEGIEIISLKPDGVHLDFIGKEGFPDHNKPVEISQVVLQDSTTAWAISTYGIYEIDLLNLKVNGHYLAPNTNNVFTYACRNNAEDMWVTNRASGVWQFDFGEKKFERLFFNTEENQVLFSNSTRAIYKDKLENVWISQLNSSAVNYTWINQNHFLNPIESLGDLAVESLVEDDQKNIWISVKNEGIYQLKSDQSIVNHFDWNDIAASDENSIPYNLTYDGDLWATGSYFVNKYDPRSNTWSTKFFRKDERFFQLLSLTAGKKLLLSNKALYVLTENENSFEARPLENLEINPLRVTRIFQGEEDRLYIPLDEKKLILCQFHEDRLVLVDSVETGSSVGSVVEDLNGNLWIATGLGVMFYSLENRTYGLLKLPVQNDSYVGAFSLILDSNQLWVSSNQGLWNYNTDHKTLIRHRAEEGLVSHNFSLYAATRAANGHLWFGTDKGLVVFHPDSTKGNPFGPSVSIKRIMINGEHSRTVIPYRKKSLDLPYCQNSLSIEPVAINYYFPEFNRVFYRVKGHIDQWTELRDEKRINLLLPPGKYELELYAQNINLVSGETTRFDLNISPPYWQTIGFRLMLLAGLVGVTYLLFRLSLRRKLQLQAKEFIRQQEIQAALQTERNRVASEMHDDIAGGLTSIRILSEKLKDNVPSSQLPTIERINDYANHLVENMREIIWSMNASYDYLNDTIAYLRHFLVGILDDAGIKLRLRVEIDATNSFILPGKLRRNILMIIKESVHNIIKHASATEVDILFDLNDDYLLISLHDNGKGIGDINPGNGLRNMKKRSKEISGTFQVLNDQGTKIILTIPTNQFTSIKTKPS